MPMSPDVFKTILAMDAYNRGNRQGVKVSYTEIGNVLVLRKLISRLDSSSSNTECFATSYIRNGQIVIFFRGTDSESGSEFIKGMTHGWPLGAGNNSADQAQQAIEFYKM